MQMPSKGNSLHEYLKKCSIKKIADVYSSRIDFIKHEQPQNQNGDNTQNYFKVNITLGSEWHDSINVENLNFPDLLVQINLTDVEKQILRSKNIRSSGKKIVVIECETQKAPWLTDKQDPRYNSYQLIKSKHQNIVFILAIFSNIKIKKIDTIFDDIWRFKRP
jgi:hypothetical protein